MQIQATNDIITLIKSEAQKREEVFAERIKAHNLPSSFKGYLSDILYAVENSKELKECSASSIVDSAIKACSYGLTIGGNIAHIVPTGKKANFRIGYNGYIMLLSRVVKVVNSIFQVVYKDDIFDYEESEMIYDTNCFKLQGAKFKYKRTNKSNEIIGAFAFISLKDKNSQIVYMPLAECEKRMQIYDIATKTFKKNDNIFHKNYKEDMMALVPLRSLARKLAKYYNCQVLLQCTAETEEVIDSEEKQISKLQTITNIQEIDIESNIPENANDIMDSKQKEFQEKRQQEMADASQQTPKI